MALTGLSSRLYNQPHGLPISRPIFRIQREANFKSKSLPSVAALAEGK
jgi:hypothetical protein